MTRRPADGSGGPAPLGEGAEPSAPDVTDERTLLAATLLADAPEAWKLLLAWPAAPAGDRADTRVLLARGRVAGVFHHDV